MSRYRFEDGEKVRIKVGKTASLGALEHNGEIVTIKKKCSFTYAYEIEEYDGLWKDGCFERIPQE